MSKRRRYIRGASYGAAASLGFRRMTSLPRRGRHQRRAESNHPDRGSNPMGLSPLPSPSPANARRRLHPVPRDSSAARLGAARLSRACPTAGPRRPKGAKARQRIMPRRAHGRRRAAEWGAGRSVGQLQTDGPVKRHVAATSRSPDPAEAKRVYDALADGGSVQVPIGETFFFGPRSACAPDRFGHAPG